MDSGTENMDGVARALRRIITFTQGGGEINIIVAGINVGAQPYWNAEATMLQHTKGILIMTPDSAMVLTGKMSLDYSGGVSAEDNFGLGGYDRVMGPNGEAQYWAPNLTAATEILFAHYDHAYVAPGERFPRRAQTGDPLDRDVQTFPHVHPDSPFTTVGEIFSAETNKDRKKPFDIRTVINAIADQDHETLERWAGMADADTSVVVDAHLGGYPVAIVGIESRNISRRGFLPADGPDQFTSGTLFPRSSKKTARAINAASGSRPLVVLANLSGFDGSPESLRNIQLEYGAEIGRAIVNFDGPIIFTRDLPLPRWRVRGVLRSAERQHGGRRRRGLVRLGDRRRPRRGRGLHPGRQHPHRERPADQGTGGDDRRRRRRRRARPSCGSSSAEAAGAGPVGEAR